MGQGLLRRLAAAGMAATITLPWVSACHRAPDTAAIVINEVLARNDAGWIDPDGDDGDPDACPEHDDFVELVNRSSAPAWLTGLTLTDGSEPPEPLILPPMLLDPGARVVIAADEQPEQGPLHAPFGVSADGETLVLRDAAGFELDRVDVPALDPDIAWARYGDGGPVWREAPSPTPGAPNEAPPDDPCLVAASVRPGFDDHTVDCIATREGFLALADTRAGLSVVKVELLSFQDPAERHAVFLDGRFFALHDEWYIFRMLNGQDVEGEDQFRPFAGEFATVDAIVDWARSVDLGSLFPTEFLWLAPTGRLTSPRFYDLALGDVRVLGAGTVVYAPPTASRDEVWAFELEYGDDITLEDLSVYFELLDRQLGPELAAHLKWLVRSPAQEALAQQIEADGLSLADRLIRYDALSEPGAVDVYNEGTVAGRVRVFAPGEAIDSVSTDILVLSEIPDLLPPCAALITSVPQTPLAHIALLAHSRGIPNLHVDGIASDPQWDSWGRIGAKVALRATAPGSFAFTALSDADYLQWQQLQASVTPVFPWTDGSALPWTVDPALVPLTGPGGLIDQRSAIGGKSSGFVALLAAGVETPPDPLAITIRGYQAHLAALAEDGVPFADALLAGPEFAHPGDPRGRWLALEGQAGYADRFPDPADETYRVDYLADNPAGTLRGDLARADGARGRVEDAPLPPEVYDALVGALRDRFAGLAPEQGIRLRSSSNVEDIEGFVGAGLYASFTGYLDPEVAEDVGGDPIDRALARTWGSYWGFEAFEERHAAYIPHENGAMGVLAHPNFADAFERSNGVVTITVLPEGAGYEMVANAQIGAISVTNPPVGGCREILPEVAVVRGDGVGPPVITRLQPSTETDGADVLSDAELDGLFADTVSVAALWLGMENTAVAASWARSTLTLDLEFRAVADGWPEQADGTVLPARMVIKQARSLEPAAVGQPDEVLAAPFPRDVLARAREVSEVTCGSASHAVTALEATTDPTLPPDLGFAVTPFTASLTVDGVTVDHLGLVAVDHPSLDPWTFDALGADDAPFASITVDADSITVDDGTASDTEPLTAPCAVTTLWAAPDTFLDDRIDAASAD